MSYARDFFWSFWPYFLSLLVIALGSACFEILTEYQIKVMIDGIANGDHIHIFWLIGMFVIYKFMRHFVFFLMRLVNIRYDPVIIGVTILAIYEKTLSHSLHWFDSNMSGDIASKVADFQDGIATLIQAVFRSTITVFTVALGIVVLCQIQWAMALVLFVFALAYVPVVHYLITRQMVLQNAFFAARQKTIGCLNDGIMNILGIKTIGSVQYELQHRFRPALAEWQASDRARKWYDAWVVDNIDTLLIVLMSAIQIYLVAHYYRQGLISAGDFAFVAILTLKIHEQLNTFLDTLLFSVNPSVAKIQSAYRFIFQEVEVQDKAGAIPLATVKGTITFDRVSFTYPGRARPVLDHFSLQIRQGERVGLVGESGAGKTTIMKGLLRYFDVNEGHILIDGHAIEDVTQDSLRAQIAIIPQDITMLHRSIYDNLLLAKPRASRAEVVEACQHANIHDVIMQMPQQYDTVVGERGVKLSGGQRQRIAIARALLKNAPILILDEATSSLDSRTEQLIQTSIDEMLDHSRATVIAIAHRLSTLKHMDRIIVLDQGRIVEEGTHASLIRKVGGQYKRLWDMQLL